MKIDRAEVESLLAFVSGNGIAAPLRGEVVASLCRLALEVMDAPEAMLFTDSESADGEEIVELSPLTAEADVAIQSLHRKRVRLVRVGEGAAR